MAEIYKSKMATFSEEGQNYFKNGQNLLDEEKQPISDINFKHRIKNEVFDFMNFFDNIVLLAGAGASVVPKRDNGKPDSNFGHTVDMLGEEVKKQLTSSTYYSIDDLSVMCKYNSSKFNLEDFLSHMQAYLQFVPKRQEKNLSARIIKLLKLLKRKLLIITIRSTLNMQH